MIAIIQHKIEKQILNLRNQTKPLEKIEAVLIYLIN